MDYTDFDNFNSPNDGVELSDTLNDFRKKTNGIIKKIDDPNSVNLNKLQELAGKKLIGNTGASAGDCSEVDIVDESGGISNNDNDTSIPTSAAVKDYVDAATVTTGLPLQYVNNHVTTTHHYDKTADVDLHVTQLDTSVTLKDANSKVYITAMITAESYTHNGVWKLFRKVGGTETEIGSNTGTTGNNRRGIATGMYDGDDSSTPNNVYIQYMDTPGSASVEYLFKWNSDGTGNNYFTLNGSQLVTTDEDYEQASSNVNLVEIGG
jgi:galactitol-specific phosphotransferase system IIB component